MSDIYKIAVRLTMEGNAPSFMAALSRQFLHVHAQVRDLEGSMLRLSRVKLAVGGGLAIAGGLGMLKGLKSITDQAKELSHELATIRTYKMDPIAGAALAQRADILARATTQSVAGTTESGNVKLYGEVFSMFGEAGAAKVLQPLARFGQVLGGITGNYEQSSEKLYSMIRAGDLSGKIVNDKTREVDPNKLLGYLDIAAKVAAATHGKVGPDAFFAMAQQGAPALKGMSDDGLMGMVMAAQGMGGFRAGTASMSLFQQFAGGKMTKQVADHLHALGLVGNFHTVRGGGVQFEKGGLETPFIQKLLKDPLAGVGMLGDTLTSRGIVGDAQTKALFQILGRQTTQRLVSDMLANLPQMVAERGRIAGAQGTDAQAETRNANDYETAEHNLGASWKTLMEAIGGPQTSAAVAVMQKATVGLNGITEAVRGMNPDTLKAIGIGIAGIGAGLVGAGAVALIAAMGPAGWLIGGVTALGIALTAMKPEAMKNIVGGIRTAWDGLLHLDFGKMISGIGRELQGAFGLLPDKVRGAILSAIASIGSIFTNAVSGLAGLVHSSGAAPGEAGSKFQQAPGSGGGRYHPSSYIPDSAHGASVPTRSASLQPINLKVDLDGRTIAENTTKHQVDMHEFVGSIGTHDNYGSYYPAGGSTFSA